MNRVNIGPVEQSVHLISRVHHLNRVVQLFLRDDPFLNQHTLDRAKATRHARQQTLGFDHVLC